MTYREDPTPEPPPPRPPWRPRWLRWSKELGTHMLQWLGLATVISVFVVFGVVVVLGLVQGLNSPPQPPGPVIMEVRMVEGEYLCVEYLGLPKGALQYRTIPCPAPAASGVEGYPIK